MITVSSASIIMCASFVEVSGRFLDDG